MCWANGGRDAKGRRRRRSTRSRRRAAGLLFSPRRLPSSQYLHLQSRHGRFLHELPLQQLNLFQMRNLLKKLLVGTKTWEEEMMTWEMMKTWINSKFIFKGV